MTIENLLVFIVSVLTCLVLMVFILSFEILNLKRANHDQQVFNEVTIKTSSAQNEYNAVNNKMVQQLFDRAGGKR